MKLLKTGIAGLDEFLTGGLPPKVLLLTGPPGSGMEVFARQVMYNQAKHVGVTYFVVEKTPCSVKEDMALYNWDVTALEAAGFWKFKTLLKNDDVKKIVLEEIEKDRSIVFDSLSEVPFIREIDEVVTYLSTACRKNKGTVYQMFLLTEGMQDPKVEVALQHSSEGVIVFNDHVKSDGIQRSVLIKKMNGSFAPSRRLPYSINKRGFIVETATRIT
jgi:KaiC/GvpD/RAD55 family RecA-like ATPase